MVATIEIRALNQRDASALAPLIAAYAQQMRRGAPRRPDRYYAERLTDDRTAEIVGAMVGEELVGFGVFFDLPEPITGNRQGQLSDLFVLPAHRGTGIGRSIVSALVAEGQSRGWSVLRWLVPNRNEAGLGFSGRVADRLAVEGFEIVIDRLAV